MKKLIGQLFSGLFCLVASGGVASAATPCPLAGVDPNICSRVIHFFDDLAKHNPDFAKEWVNHHYVYQGGGSVTPGIRVQDIEYRPGRWSDQAVGDDRMSLQQFVAQELADPQFAPLAQSHNYFAMTVLALEHAALDLAGSTWHETFYLSGPNLVDSGGTGYLLSGAVADSRGVSPALVLSPPPLATSQPVQSPPAAPGAATPQGTQPAQPPPGAQPPQGTTQATQPTQPTQATQPAQATQQPPQGTQQPPQSTQPPQGTQPAQGTPGPQAVPTSTSSQTAPPGTTRENINVRFVTPDAGSQTQINARSYMLDSEQKLWSCVISGMGMRVVADQNANMISSGHVETLHIKSVQMAHIPGNHAQTNRCLVSVHK